MRPEVEWKRVAGGRGIHIFLEGADTPVCGAQARRWVAGVREGKVHAECWRLCPWRPRLNAVTAEAQLLAEI
jgi:hypothetical protein